MKNTPIIILSTLFVTLCFASCGKSPVKAPSESQIKAICELTTVEAYYNNLAKSTIKKEGLLDIWDKEREFWIEYEGYAKIGIDMTEVSMELSENTVTIAMPQAKLQETGVKSKTFDYISSDKGIFFPIEITAEEQTSAVTDAQNNMKEEVLKNKALFVQAQDKAKILIENYINKLGEMSGIKYEIIWKTKTTTSEYETENKNK